MPTGAVCRPVRRAAGWPADWVGRVHRPQARQERQTLALCTARTRPSWQWRAMVSAPAGRGRLRDAGPQDMPPPTAGRRRIVRCAAEPREGLALRGKRPEPAGSTRFCGETRHLSGGVPEHEPAGSGRRRCCWCLLRPGSAAYPRRFRADLLPPSRAGQAPSTSPEGTSGFQLRRRPFDCAQDLRLRFNRAGRPAAIMTKSRAGSGIMPPPARTESPMLRFTAM